MKRILLFLVILLVTTQLFSLRSQAKEALTIEQTFLANLKDYKFTSDKLMVSLEENLDEIKGTKSKSLAALLSLILPGTGELYAGAGRKGRIFMGTEASLWAGVFSFRTYGSWLKEDYKNHAALHAGVNLEGKSDDFFDDIERYFSRDEYNQLEPVYYRGEAQLYPEDDLWNWEWDSIDSNRKYRRLKDRSKAAYTKALFVAGLAVVNRVVSIVDAVKTVKAYNQKRRLELSSIKIGFKATPLSSHPQYMVFLRKSF